MKVWFKFCYMVGSCISLSDNGEKILSLSTGEKIFGFGYAFFGMEVVLGSA